MSGFGVLRKHRDLRPWPPRSSLTPLRSSGAIPRSAGLRKVPVALSP